MYDIDNDRDIDERYEEYEAAARYEREFDAAENEEIHEQNMRNRDREIAGLVRDLHSLCRDMGTPVPKWHIWDHVAGGCELDRFKADPLIVRARWILYAAKNWERIPKSRKARQERAFRAFLGSEA